MTWADYDGALELRSHTRSWFDRFFSAPRESHAFGEFQYPTAPLHLQPDAHKAVLGAWERLDVPLTVAA